MKTENQSYYNLTAQQARHFIDTGKLLIVERIGPQPDKVENGVALLEDMNGLYYEYEPPFRIGETTRFREPWTWNSMLAKDDRSILLNSFSPFLETPKGVSRQQTCFSNSKSGFLFAHENRYRPITRVSIKRRRASVASN